MNDFFDLPSQFSEDLDNAKVSMTELVNSLFKVWQYLEIGENRLSQRGESFLADLREFAEYLIDYHDQNVAREAAAVLEE